MKYRKNGSRHNSLESIIRRDYLSIKSNAQERMEFYLTQDTTVLGLGGGLHKCWKGYKITKSEGGRKNMEYYAKSIRKFHRELKTSVSEFLQFGPLGRNYCSYKQGS